MTPPHPSSAPPPPPSENAASDYFPKAMGVVGRAAGRSRRLPPVGGDVSVGADISKTVNIQGLLDGLVEIRNMIAATQPEAVRGVVDRDDEDNITNIGEYKVERLISQRGAALSILKKMAEDQPDAITDIMPVLIKRAEENSNPASINGLLTLAEHSHLAEIIAALVKNPYLKKEHANRLLNLPEVIENNEILDQLYMTLYYKLSLNIAKGKDMVIIEDTYGELPTEFILYILKKTPLDEIHPNITFCMTVDERPEIQKTFQLAIDNELGRTQELEELLSGKDNGLPDDIDDH